MIAKDDILHIHLIDITRLIKPEKEDLERLLDLLEMDKVNIRHLRSFMYGSVLSHLSPQIITWFCDSILKFGPEGHLVALSILFGYCHNQDLKYIACIDHFKKIACVPGLIRYLDAYSRSDSHQWATIVSKLLKDSEHDVMLAKDIAKNIAEACIDKDYDYRLAQDLQKVITILLARYRDDVWNIFSNLLLTEDSLLRFDIISLFGVDTDLDGNYEGVMLKLPNEFLINWCDENADSAPKIICEIIPVIIKSDDSYTFHPIIQYLIDKYGSNENVLKYIYHNLGPSLWSGSVIPYYEQQISSLNKLIIHTNVKVRNWAERIIRHRRMDIEKNREKEDEESIGIY